MIDSYSIRCIKNLNNSVINDISQILSFDNPMNYDSNVQWLTKWFSDKIPGDKITLIAEKNNYIIGTVRFWKSPYCGTRWLIQGLSVIPSERRKGVAISLLEHGFSLLKDNAEENVFSHILIENAPSINLHKKLGFTRLRQGCINSYGEYTGDSLEFMKILK